MVVYTLLKKHAFVVLKCQKNGPSDQSEMTQDQSWPQGAHVWYNPIQVLYPQFCHNYHPKRIHLIKLALLLSHPQFCFYLQLHIHLKKILQHILPWSKIPLYSWHQSILIALPLFSCHYSSNLLSPALPHVSSLLIG